MSDREPKSLRALAGPVYLIAGLLVLLPFIDLVSNVWPLRFGELQWRYGAMGLVSGFLLTPLIGLTLAYVAAVSLDQRPVQRVLAVIAWAGAGVLLVGALLFTLDALQLRGSAPAEALSTFDTGLVKAVFKDFAVVAALSWLGLVGWRGSRRSGGRRRRPTTPVIRAEEG